MNLDVSEERGAQIPQWRPDPSSGAQNEGEFRHGRFTRDLMQERGCFTYTGVRTHVEASAA